MANRYGENERCEVCNYEHIREDHNHNNTPLHIFNFHLWEWKRYRKALVKNRHGIELQVKHKTENDCECDNSFNEKKGIHAIKLTPRQFGSHNNCLTFECTIRNKRSSSIIITGARLIHPLNLFRCYDKFITNGNFVELLPGAEHNFYVDYQCWPASIGSIQNSLAVNFQTKNDDQTQQENTTEDEKDGDRFTIVKTFCIQIAEDFEAPDTESSPFKDEDWGDNITIKFPSQKTKYIDKYPIPEEFRESFKMGFKELSGMSLKTKSAIYQLRAQMIPGYVTLENYNFFFHNILWLEEMGIILMLRKYNMSKVNVIVKHKTVELVVPGLAEKRPSLIVGDTIDIRVHEDHTAYRGHITRVNDKTIDISYIADELIQYLQNNPKVELDVRFNLGRLSLERQHEGVDRVCINRMLTWLFPMQRPLAHQVQRQLNQTDFLNKTIYDNKEQRVAVTNIIFNTSRNFPYIVFGPPGTGKTVTIVEAILQLKRRTNKQILVCAPANAAGHMITMKLMQHCNKSELIRVISESADMNVISTGLKEYTNISEGEVVKTPVEKLRTYRIIVTTLILIGRYANKFKPDIVFVDEAAQAAEPEVDIAIGFLGESKHLVLAGDPKQLGPSCASKVSEGFGYGKSLLERLMTTDTYKSGDPNFITMLIRNFRSHPLILKIPNELFYDDKLLPMSTEAKNDEVSKYFILDNKPIQNSRKKNGLKRYPGQPIEFYGVISKERREGRSPSYYNPAEIQVVINYVTALLTSSKFNVEENEIGIVTPYIRQVYKIKDKLRKENFSDVEVGTTETFQGREKRIIIISTVRAQHSLLKFDRKYNLGFVRHDKRFNVALTRAISKLIVIGCPHVLGYDTKWRKYMELCEGHHAYFGAPFIRRTEEVITSISRNLHSITRNDTQFNRNNNRRNRN